MGFFTAILISFLIGPYFIAWMQKKQYGEQIRTDGPQGHFSKKGTPTMGGTFILLALVVGTLCWSRLDHPYTWLVIAITVGYGAIGFADDWIKVHYKNKAGLAGRKKLFWQTLIATVALLGTYWWALPSFHPVHVAAPAPHFWRMGLPWFQDLSPTELHVPFFKNVRPDIGWLYLPFAVFVIVAMSNAVNLTDGLDGLAIGPTMIWAGTFGVFSYLGGNAVFAEYLKIPHVPDAGELIIFCAATIGAGMGFLWYNTYPAQVFMGDVGALALGGALGAVSVVTKNEFIGAFVGGIFVLEAVSVVTQVASFKLTGKRIFKMAPIHHHFELKGWPEPRVIVRFWIIAILLALMGLATLKLR
ncbi:MAG TPA: phospho-N-acetylmuramoyl-pentapeptide-transferase [bacterium]|nr:phospho-N-acetylmuramoyl-pentapeptide-transferase [bacterium]